MICILNKYYSSDQIENNDMGGACGMHGGRRADGKKPLGRRARRCEDNIKINVEEVGWGTWNELIRLRIRTGGGLLRMR